MKELFLLSFFNCYWMIYDNVGSIRDPLKQDLALEFCRRKIKDISYLTHINHDQIHHHIHIRNNWLNPICFSPGDSTTKGSLVLIHLGFEGITEVDTNPKEGFVSFKVTPLPLMTEFFMFILLQGIAPGNSWLGDISLRDRKIIWKIKMSEMK